MTEKYIRWQICKNKTRTKKKKLYVRGLLHIITLSLHNYIIINGILNVRYAYWSLRFCPITGLELKFLSFSLKVNILNNKWRECWESMALFFSRLVITYYFDQELFVYANCAVHYICQWEQWYWKLIYVLLSNVCFPGMCCSVFCRQFYRSCFLFLYWCHYARPNIFDFVNFIYLKSG